MSSLVVGDGEEEGNNACWRKEVLVLLVMVVDACKGGGLEIGLKDMR